MRNKGQSYNHKIDASTTVSKGQSTAKGCQTVVLGEKRRLRNEKRKGIYKEQQILGKWRKIEGTKCHFEGGTSAIASPPQLIHELMKPEQKNKPSFCTCEGEAQSGHPEQNQIRGKRSNRVRARSTMTLQQLDVFSHSAFAAKILQTTGSKPGHW